MLKKNILPFQYQLKKEHDSSKTITYKIKFIDSYRFMQIKLSDLVDNLSEIKNKDCKTPAKSINGLIKKFPSVYQFCNGDLNKFVLLLRKGVYPYEYMDSWEKFDETSFSDKTNFYSVLNLEDITDEDYERAKKYGKYLE